VRLVAAGLFGERRIFLWSSESTLLVATFKDEVSSLPFFFVFLTLLNLLLLLTSDFQDLF
jgi:hypothetical protein